jgi:PAS domain S-box-containing protein
MTTAGAVTVRLRESAAAAGLPEAVVQYAARTKEPVILDDASAGGPFSGDEYVRRRHARSILCLPLVKQGRLVALLYLENNLTAGVFTPARIAVLNLLASQAAISLENTRLYRDLEEREAKIRRLVDANIIGIFIWSLDGEILEANEAFLHTVGYGREDLASGRLRWTDLTPAEWLDRDVNNCAGTKRAGASAAIRKEYFRDGSRIPVLIGWRRSTRNATGGRLCARFDRASGRRHENARAEAANRAKDEFLANVSHDPHPPNAILGMTSWPRHRADQRQRQYLRWSSPRPTTCPDHQRPARLLQDRGRQAHGRRLSPAPGDTPVLATRALKGLGWSATCNRKCPTP